MRPLKNAIKKLLLTTGYDIQPLNCYTSFDLRRSRLFEKLAISCSLDVGGNVGAYGKLLRRNGFTGRIISFEPLTDAYQELSLAASADGNWECHNIGLSDKEEVASINITGNSVSSSLLQPTEAHVNHSPGSAVFSKQDISLNRLDQVIDDLGVSDDHVFMKVDVQGYEMNVLQGCGDTLGSFKLLEIELGLIPFYSGQPDYQEVLKFLSERDFSLIGVGPNTVSEDSGVTFEVNALFSRTHSIL